MQKINEFINNKDVDYFNKLSNDLFYETAHLSNLDDIKNSTSYRKIVSGGVKFVPFVVDSILKSNVWSYRLILSDLVGDITDLKNLNYDQYKVVIYDWWLKNKINYGRQGIL